MELPSPQSGVILHQTLLWTKTHCDYLHCVMLSMNKIFIEMQQNSMQHKHQHFTLATYGSVSAQY